MDIAQRLILMIVMVEKRVVTGQVALLQHLMISMDVRQER